MLLEAFLCLHVWIFYTLCWGIHQHFHILCATDSCCADVPSLVLSALHSSNTLSFCQVYSLLSGSCKARSFLFLTALPPQLNLVFMLCWTPLSWKEVEASQQPVCQISPANTPVSLTCETQTQWKHLVLFCLIYFTNAFILLFYR